MPRADPGATVTTVASRRLRPLPVLVTGVLASSVVAVTTWLDGTLVTSQQSLDGVEFGVPLAWVAQDQGSVDPELPHSAHLASPWEFPTSIHGLALLTDVLVVALVLAAVYLAVGRLDARSARR